jgi:hypothetical protein
VSAYTRQPVKVVQHCPHQDCNWFRIVFENADYKMPASVRAYVQLQRHLVKVHPPVEVANVR